MGHSVLVVLENGLSREVLGPDPELDAKSLPRLRKWLQSAVCKVQDAGICVSFQVGVHVVAADCDHEVSPRQVKP